MPRPYLIVLAFLLSLAPALRGAGVIKDAQLPAWVQLQPVDLQGAINPDWVHLDRQLLEVDTQYDEPAHTFFRRVVMRVQSTAALDQGVDRSVSFDQDTETLRIHRLQVIRDGRTIDLLPDQDIRTFDAGQDDSGVYTGDVAARLILNDVRVGDIVDFAYSIEESHPVFPGQDSDKYFLAWDAPAAHVFVRLLWPHALPLRQRTGNGLGEPAITDAGGGIDAYAWTLDRVPAVAYDDETPDWYFAEPFVEFTSWQGWDDLAETIAPFFDMDQPLPAELQAVVTAAKQHNDKPQDVALELLRYVQENIRYVSLSLGEHSYRPYGVATTCARRYGDCKDKALMLSLMLRRAGIVAWPALVSTWMQQNVGDALPRPGCFDHVIVWADIDGGLFIDPTDTYNRGPLAQSYLPDYGWALLLRKPSTSGLVRVDGRGADAAVVEAAEHYELAGDGSAALATVTTYHGEEADAMREGLDGQDRAQLSAQYLNAYARRFPSIQVAQPLAVADDPAANTVTTTEHYTIPRFFEPDATHTGGVAYIGAWLVRNAAVPPQVRVRREPLQLDYPTHLRHTVELAVPPGAPYRFDPGTRTIEDAGMRFQWSVQWRAPVLTLHAAYDVKRPWLPAAGVPGFARDVDSVAQAASFAVLPPSVAPVQQPAEPRGPEGRLWQRIAGGALGIIALSLGIAALRHRKA